MQVIAQDISYNNTDENHCGDDDDILYSDDFIDENDDDDVVVLEFDDPEQEDIVFTLPDVPGAPEAADIEIEDGDIQEEDDKNVDVERDPWNWQGLGLGNFLTWLKGMIDGCPRHSGYDVGGLERAVSYFELLLKEVSKAMRMDYKSEIDVAKAEEARDQIEKGIERMLDRLDKVKASKYKRYKKKTKSWVEKAGLIKEGQKTTHISGVTLVVPLFISRLARILINGTVSAGHDMEDMYQKLKEEYDLTKREEAELQQLLADMNYPIYQDRGIAPGKQIDTTRSDNFDWPANYKAY